MMGGHHRHHAGIHGGVGFEHGDALINVRADQLPLVGTWGTGLAQQFLSLIHI